MKSNVSKHDCMPNMVYDIIDLEPKFHKIMKNITENMNISDNIYQIDNKHIKIKKLDCKV